jgi:hypothetical protein
LYHCSSFVDAIANIYPFHRETMSVVGLDDVLLTATTTMDFFPYDSKTAKTNLKTL